MTPEDLAARHPRLYLLTTAGGADGIRRHGLLPTTALLDLFETPPEHRPAIERTRRPARVTLHHPVHGTAVITDNVPLQEASLAACLDDGLRPADWVRMLNARVFFWPDEAGLETLLQARLNRGLPREVLVVDTLGLARAHADRMELSPINSGSTIRRPARRGLATFTPLTRHDYPAWQRLRGRRDTIREVTVVGRADVAPHLIDTLQISPPTARSDAPGSPPPA